MMPIVKYSILSIRYKNSLQVARNGQPQRIKWCMLVKELTHFPYLKKMTSLSFVHDTVHTFTFSRFCPPHFITALQGARPFKACSIHKVVAIDTHLSTGRPKFMIARNDQLGIFLGFQHPTELGRAAGQVTAPVTARKTLYSCCAGSLKARGTFDSAALISDLGTRAY